MNKTNRLFRLLLCLATVLCLVGVLAACTAVEDNCNHEWGEWETVNPATCTEKGLERRVCALNEHHFEERETEALGHSFGEYTSNGDATCAQDGTKTAACTREGCEVTDTVADAGSKTSHVFENTIVGEAYLKSAATCTAPAVYYKSCACGEKGTETFEDGNAINHANETCTFEKAAGCVEDGVKKFTCPDCGREREEKLTASGHTWETVETVTANCEHGGYTLRKCKTCQTQERIDETPITDCTETSKVIKEASCTEAGVREYTCSVCKKTRTEVIPQKDHDYATEVIDPTCTEGGYTLHTCADCGATYMDAPTASLGGHKFEVSNDLSSAPTCTAAGLTVEVCTNKGCTAKHETVVPPTDHKWVAPTCTEDGYCENCLEKGEIALGHTYSELVKDVAPTCTEDGYLTHKCARCDATKETTPELYRAKGHNESAIEWAVEPVLVDKSCCQYVTRSTGSCPDCGTTVTKDSDPYTNHKFYTTVASNATCCTQGRFQNNCSACGYTELGDYYDAPESHAWDAGTLQADGVTTLYVCQHNGEHTKTTVSAKNETDATISADTLNKADEIELKDATLALDEATKQQIGDANVSLHAGKLEDKAELEAALAQLSQADRDRLGNGNIYNFTMEIGGELTSQFNGKITVRIPYALAEGEDRNDIVICYINGDTPVLIEAKYVEINGQGYAEFETDHFSYYTVTRLTPAERCAMYGHSHVSTVVRPTCLTGGYTVTICRRCGEKTISDETAALGHAWKLDESTYVKPGCATAGYEKYVCQTCHISYTVVTDAPGHEWALDAKQSTEATCEHAGKEVYVCKTCGDSYTKTLPRVAHQTRAEVIAPDCTNGGYTTYTCQNCGYSYVADLVDPMGHDMVDEIHEPTCVSKGYTSHFCKNCDTVFANTNEVPMTDHAWNREAPDCTNDKVCIHCGALAEGGKATGHNMKDGACVNCGTTCDHDYKLSHTVAPTCAAEGYEVYVCSICNKSENRINAEKADHTYQPFSTIEATCQAPAYQINVCSTCGDKQEIAVGEKKPHNFVNGACTMCGTTSEIFFLNMIESFKDFTAFSIRIENFSFEMKSLFTDTDGSQEEAVLGRFQTMDVTELMLNFAEDGTITGAARGTCKLLVDGIEATANMRAIIQDNVLYVSLTVAMDDDSREITLRASVDKLIDVMKDEMGYSAENMEILESTINDVILPALQKIRDGNAEDLEDIVSDLINILFTQSATKDGYVFTLDIAKLKTLNERLASEGLQNLLNTYFGEGTFDDLSGFVTEVLTAKISELPAIAAKLTTLTEEELYTLVNAVCHNLMGAPEEFDIQAVIENPEFADMTLGTLMEMGEDYEAQLAEMIKQLAETSVYQMIGAPEEFKAEIDKLLTDLEGTIVLGLHTDANGTFLGLEITANEFSWTMVQRENIGVETPVYPTPPSEDSDHEVEVKPVEPTPDDGEDGTGTDDQLVDMDGDGKFDGYITEKGEYIPFNASDSKRSASNGTVSFDYVTTVPGESFGNVSEGDVSYDTTVMNGQWVDVDADGKLDGIMTDEGVFIPMTPPTGEEKPEEEKPTSTRTWENTLLANGSIFIDKNGTIEVTWTDIVDAINKLIVLPEREDDETDGYSDYGFYGTELEYNGKWYRAEGLQFTTVRYRNLYSDVVAVTTREDCGEQYQLIVSYMRERYESRVGMFELSDPKSETEQSFWVIVNMITGEILECQVSEDGRTMTVTLANGEKRTVEMPQRMEEYGSLGVAVFGEQAMQKTSSYLNTYEIYYNPTTKQFSESSGHNYVLDESKGEKPETCEKRGTRYYVCANCGDVMIETYYQYHEWDYRYTAQNPELGCEGGILTEYACIHCGEVRDSWTDKGHRYEDSFRYENGVLYHKQSCAICGKSNMSERPILNIDSDLTFKFMEDVKGFVRFAFTPTETGNYQFYTSGSYRFGDISLSVYDSKDYYLNSMDDQWFGNGNRGYTFAMEAGQTYYIHLQISVRGDNAGEPKDLIVELPTSETVELTPEMGCGCGGKLVLFNQYGRKSAKVEANCKIENEYETCPDCGFFYYFGEYMGTDASCAEIATRVLIYTNDKLGVKGEYAYDTYYTGNTNHRVKGESYDEETEVTDENGKTYFVHVSTHVESCVKCGNQTYKRVYTSHYNKDEGTFYAKEERFEFSYNLNALYLYSVTETYYNNVLTEEGWFEQQVSRMIETYYNENGEITNSSKTEYVRNGCQVTEIVTENGSTWENTYFNHKTASKLLPDESGTTEFTDENGNKLTETVETYEEYCIYCGAGLNKTTTKTTVDAYGHLIKEEYLNYDLYANSETDYGYALSRREVNEFGVYEYAEGKFLLYRLGYAHEEYDLESGNLIWRDGYRYVYPEEGNYCRYQRLWIYSDGSEHLEDYVVEEHIDMHSEYRLRPGATSCKEGLDEYRVCIGCGYEELWGEYVSSYHDTWMGTRIELPIRNYGAACDGYVEIRTCPCGQVVEWSNNAHCDMDWNHEWIDDGLIDHYRETIGCAVTDPIPCNFEIWVETWSEYGENCTRLQYERITIGAKSENPYVIETVQSFTGSHTYEQIHEQTEEELEDGTVLYTSTTTDQCINCGHQSYKTTYVSCYSNLEQIELWAEETTVWYYTNGTPSEQSFYRYEKILYKDGDYEYDRQVMVYSKRENFNENGDVTWWTEAIYDYSKCILAPIVTEANSDGWSDTFQAEHDYYGYEEWICEPTCTQPGICVRFCDFCDASEEFTYQPNGHYYQYDSAIGMHCCYNCGLKNLNGYDGAVILEDLTARENKEGYYVIGYYFYKTEMDCFVSLSVVVDGKDEPIFLEYLPEFDDSKIYISIEDVRKEVEALGYSLCRESLRVTMVPTNFHDELDYAITLDPHVMQTKVEKTPCGDELHVTVCTLCGTYTNVEHHNVGCSFADKTDQYTVTDENGNVHYIDTFKCVTCGFTYELDWYDSSTACKTEFYSRASYLLQEDGTYKYVGKPLHNLSVNHVYNSKEYTYVEKEDGTLVRCAKCVNCGETVENLTVTLHLADGMHATLNTDNTGSNMVLTLMLDKGGAYNAIFSQIQGGSMNFRVTNPETGERVLYAKFSGGEGEVGQECVLEADVIYEITITASAKNISSFVMEMFYI